MFRFFKFTMSVLTATVISVCANAQPGTGFETGAGYGTGTIWNGGGGGGSHPWPWGFEVPFPWEDIQGIWKLDKPGKALYFSFRRLESKRLAVNQFDLDACVVTGAGPGFERAKTVVAQMNEVGTRRVYQVRLYAFDPKDSPEPPKTGSAFEPGPVMVARINTLTVPSPEIAVQMVKITDRLEIRCSHSNKNLKF